MTKKDKVETIYAQMCEFSTKSYRPHQWVMGFSYDHQGASSVWWDHAHESDSYQKAKLDLVDWMHENGFIANYFINLIPLPDENDLTLPGVLIIWRPENMTSGKISSFAKEYIEGLTNATQQ